MKRFVILASVVMLAFITGGCGDPEAEHAGHEGQEVQLFEAGKGLRIPAEMHRELGIETVEVIEKTMPGCLERFARVYRAAHGAAPAAAVVMLDASEARKLTPGQGIALRNATPPGTELAGKLMRFDSLAWDRVEALLEVGDPEGRLAVGSRLLARFALGQTNVVFAVPKSAVVEGVEGAFVYAVNGNHFTRTRVKVAEAHDGSLGIIEGLYAGDVVVARGAEAMWMIELCALKGGTPCCPVPGKNSGPSTRR